jgi:hypothetical protein
MTAVYSPKGRLLNLKMKTSFPPPYIGLRDPMLVRQHIRRGGNVCRYMNYFSVPIRRNCIAFLSQQYLKIIARASMIASLWCRVSIRHAHPSRKQGNYRSATNELTLLALVCLFPTENGTTVNCLVLSIAERLFFGMSFAQV